MTMSCAFQLGGGPMGRRVYDNKAKRAFWLLHIEACQKSGSTVAAYCRQHGLTSENFRRWRREITDWEARKSAERARWKQRNRPVSADKRRKATQAFWAMHVEAWQWSGLALRDYASTHRLSSYSLKRWRILLEAEEFKVDWRTMLHPSMLPLISTKISTRTKEKEEAARLTAVLEADASPPKRARRRRFSTEEKIALLLEAERHGSTISSVAQAHGIATSVMFRWRDQLGMGKDKPAVIAPVRVIDGRERDRSGPPSLLADLLPKPDGMMEIELSDGRLVFAPAGVDADEVRRAVEAREKQS
jgi:transposase-like protein